MDWVKKWLGNSANKQQTSAGNKKQNQFQQQTDDFAANMYGMYFLSNLAKNLEDEKNGKTRDNDPEGWLHL